MGRKAEEQLAAGDAHREGRPYSHGLAIDDGRIVAQLPNGFQRRLYKGRTDFSARASETMPASLTRISATTVRSDPRAS